MAPDARSLLLTTLWLRARGTTEMKDALDAALGKTPPAAAITKMADVGADLTAADRTYQAFMTSINERQQQQVGRDAVLPPSRWIEEPQTLLWTLSLGYFRPHPGLPRSLRRR